MAGVDADYQGPVAVPGADDLGIVRIGNGDGEPTVSLGIGQLGPADHVQGDLLRVQHVVPAYGIQDHLER